MRRIILSLTILLVSGQLFAGGIVTNANQSASYVRMYARDASTALDAVYYNPAGLAFLDDGWYISLNNQTIIQRKTITNAYPALNDQEYNGDVLAPAFPGVYAVYKKNNWAFSFGFNPAGGGGSAEYEEGLPSFEVPISTLPSQLGGLSAFGLNVEEYSADLFFEGSSVFWGMQAGVTYKVNDMLSVFGGGRFIRAVNTYNGHIRNIQLMVNGEYTKASPFLANTSDMLSGLADDLYTASSNLQAAIKGGMIDSLATVSDEDIIDALTNFVDDPSSVTNNKAVDILEKGGVKFAELSEDLAGNSQAVADKDVDVRQVATGFTPILGVNIVPAEGWNIGIKYEFNTTLEFENDTEVDGTGQFPDGGKFRNDMPALLSAGVSYQLFDNFKVSSGMHYFFDKNADWDGKEEEVDANLWEVAMGFEYDVTDQILISAGYLYGNTGVGRGYQTDLKYSLNSNTVGFGGRMMIHPAIAMNLGMSYTVYEDGYKFISYDGDNQFRETYDKNNLIFSIGFDVNIKELGNSSDK
ncbi:MAG: hypothetical protein R6U66_11745 [Bacteroidales bacterium]